MYRFLNVLLSTTTYLGFGYFIALISDVISAGLSKKEKLFLTFTSAWITGASIYTLIFATLTR